MKRPITLVDHPDRRRYDAWLDTKTGTRWVGTARQVGAGRWEYGVHDRPARRTRRRRSAVRGLARECRRATRFGGAS